MYTTRKKNKSFNISKIEKDIETYLNNNNIKTESAN